MSGEIKGNEGAETYGRTDGDITDGSLGHEDTTGISEGLNLGFEEIDVFSDLNSLYEDEWEEEESTVRLEDFPSNVSAAGEDLHQLDPALHKLGINTVGFSSRDRMEAMRRINYYMGYRDDISKYSYNHVYDVKPTISNEESFEEKENVSIAREIEMYEKVLDDTIEQIVAANNSSHTDANSDYLKSELLANIKEHNNNFEDEEFNSNAVATIREMLGEKDNLNSEEVFERIIENFPEKAFVYYANREKYVQSISYLVNLYATSMKKAYHYQKMHENTSESIVFLFKKDRAELQQLAEENSNHNVTYIKQILKNDNELFTKCACGKYVKVILASKLYIYGENDNFHVDYFPIGAKCPDCGKVHILSENDLAECIAMFKVKNSDVLKNFVLSSIKNCHVGSFGKYKVSLGKITDFFSDDMITDKSDGDIDIVVDNNKEEKTDPFIVDLQSDKEYYEAIAEFYKQLHTFSKDTLMLSTECFNIRSGDKIIYSCDTEKLNTASIEASPELKEHMENLKNISKVNRTTTYGVMAAFVASRVNLDYHKTKNRAIFSLLLSIQSNPVIRAHTGLGDLNEKYADIHDLKECLSFTPAAIPAWYKTILINILSKYRSDIQDVENVDLKVMWKYAIELQKNLENEIVKCEKSLEELRDLLYEMEEALVYTKIVNINTMQLYEISYLLSDKDFANFCDRIADRMIITNYAEHIVTWRSSTASALSKVQDSRTFRKICVSFIGSGLDGYRMVQNAETFSKNAGYLLDKYYKVTEDTSFLRMSASADVYDALKKCDYAQALKLCHNAKIDASQLGDSCKKLTENACKNINEFYEKTKELCDLEENSFYFVLAGFLIEELDDSCVYKFSTKHIPKRIGNETIEQYNTRVKKGEELVTIESSKFFEEIHRDLIVIMMISNACKLEKKSFVNTAFMTSTIDMIVNCMNYNNTCELFKISTDAYNMYENQVYSSDLYLKDGKWFSALEFYNGNEEMAAALTLKSKSFEHSMKVDVKDSISLENVTTQYLDDMFADLEQLSASGKALIAVSKSENTETDELITDFDPFTIVSYIKDFLEVE